VIGLRPALIFLVMIAGFVVSQQRASAQWWRHAPTDFEECADAAEKAATKEDKTSALADCNAKFAGRRKAGGGYTYYDFLQDRTFDIAGPNPTPEEQKYIDEQYTLYLEKQRRSTIAAALSAKQQELLQASLRSETERVPVPPARPKLLPATTTPNEARPRARAGTCARHSFSCEWPRLSEGLNDLKKLFSSSPAKPKRS
jgi:hypothetical protein